MPCSSPRSTPRTSSTRPAPSWIAEVSERLAVGKKTGPNPTDRRKRGSQHHVLTDAQGVPLAALVTGAHRHDVTQLLPLLEAIPPVRGKCGRPRRRPRRFRGTGGMMRRPTRRRCARWGSPRCSPHAAPRMAVAWVSLAGVVEQPLAWLPPWRRLRVRYERRATGMKPFSLAGMCTTSYFKIKLRHQKMIAIRQKA